MFTHSPHTHTQTHVNAYQFMFDGILCVQNGIKKMWAADIEGKLLWKNLALLQIVVRNYQCGRPQFLWRTDWIWHSILVCLVDSMQLYKRYCENCGNGGA